MLGQTLAASGLVGAAISNINIGRSGVSLFTRDVTIGGNAFTEEIQKQLGIAADEAEAYKVGGNQTEDGVVPQEVLRVMDGVSEVMAGEFQRTPHAFESAVGISQTPERKRGPPMARNRRVLTIKGDQAGVLPRIVKIYAIFRTFNGP